ELVPEIRQHKAELMSLVYQRKALVGDGQLPPLDLPPATETELRRLIDYLDDPVSFAQWFERLMQQTDPSVELRWNDHLVPKYRREGQ
ncbi:MAG TPA: hypothetical protein VFA32_20470, partial [Dehalococcoidia bacterium]|nr:hypothetical protein [Dehalococcoidia bacterium]